MLAWLEQRARGSTGEERAAWWKHMLALGAAERVAVMGAEGVPEPGQGGSLLETYLRAQAQLGDNRSFAAALIREIGAVDDPERARSLARLARESGVAAAHVVSDRNPVLHAEAQLGQKPIDERDLRGLALQVPRHAQVADHY